MGLVIKERGFMIKVCLSRWETRREKKRFNKKQNSSCDQLVNEYLYKCDLLCGITKTSHISVCSCTESVHADSPPPRTLISYGARDWVQTSTSPNEISF